MMTKPKVVYSPNRQKPKLKVMHEIKKDENGAPTISSRQIDPKPVKLKEAVDAQQAAEETGHKAPSPKDVKAKEAVKPKDKDELSDEQRSVLKALHDLGGKDKDIHSMDIAKKLGFDKTHKNAPRAPVRNAMERLHSLHLVTSKKEGVKYSFRITDKGVEALKAKSASQAKTEKDKGAHNPAPVSPASTASSGSIQLPNKERPANTDRICPKCSTANPFMAEYCKNCGEKLQSVQTVTAVRTK